MSSWNTFRFVIHGRPVTKKNSMRIARNRKTGASFIMQSVQQKAWMQKALPQLRVQFNAMGAPCAITEPVNMCAIVYRERATGDLLNYLAAVSDALESAGVIANDKQVVSVDGSRLDKDAKDPRVEVTLTCPVVG